MSSPLSTIPKRARVLAYAHAKSPDGTRSATFAVYDTNASRGYQTGYAAVPTAWYAVDAPGVVRRCWRYSGARYRRALTDYAAAVAEVRAAGWSVTE
jgi:hypothetical protein